VITSSRGLPTAADQCPPAWGRAFWLEGGPAPRNHWLRVIRAERSRCASVIECCTRRRGDRTGLDPMQPGCHRVGDMMLPGVGSPGRRRRSSTASRAAITYRWSAAWGRLLPVASGGSNVMSRHCRCSLVGGALSFPFCPSSDAPPSKAVIYCLKPRQPTLRLFQRLAGRADKAGFPPSPRPCGRRAVARLRDTGCDACTA
jgi:hypothetical protein